MMLVATVANQKRTTTPADEGPWHRSIKTDSFHYPSRHPRGLFVGANVTRILNPRFHQLLAGSRPSQAALYSLIRHSMFEANLLFIVQRTHIIL